MIATLRGKITQKNNGIIIECNGVGYGVFVTLADLSALAVDSDTLLYVHEHIREDAHNLFGFIQEDTKKLFEQLLGVKNVGPKVALAVLDTGTSDTVRMAIASGDVKFLQSAKGVGKRAAEQIIVELRDKVGSPVGEAAESLVYRSGVNQNDEALQALVSLGYTEGDAQHALQGIDAELSVEERIKQALAGGR